MTTKSGIKYHGLIKTVSMSGENGVVLKNAKQMDPTQANGSQRAEGEVKINAEDLVEVFSAKLSLNRSSESMSATAETTSKAWKTDTDISGRGQVTERVLQAWQPPADDQGFSIEDELNTKKQPGSGKKWDQFAANEQLFGVKSQWDEDMYTHKLDTSRPDFAKRQADAERLAREIEQSSSTNAHVLEERGVVDDSGMTEEDKYSGVQRAPGAWIPPARRPVANLPQPRAVSQVDPAIISSQLARPGTSGHRPANSVVHASTSGAAKDASTTALPSTKPANPIEADIMARFKQFATHERDRLVVRKAASIKKEKDGRLQDLLAFSKDFKLNTPVPEDLIPILAKDKAKQDAIVQKAASSVHSSPSVQKTASPNPNPTDIKSPDTMRARVDKAHQGTASSIDVKPVPREQTPDLRKLKPSATEFKPFNPAASSFTPGFSQRAPQPSSPALSTTSSQPRQSSFSVEAASFYPRKPKPPTERTPILEHFNPFESFKIKNPESALDIEAPLKVDPSWPGDESHTITDAPQDSRRSAQSDEQYQSLPAFGQAPPVMYVGSPQQAQAFQQQSFYGNKGQHFMQVPPGQFIPYQAGPGFVPPQYMYQGAAGYSPRAMQPHMLATQYPAQQYNGYNQQLSAAMSSSSSYAAHNQGSPRPRQSFSQGQQRSPEIQKPTPRPPPMDSGSVKDT